jgi:hypothetical protein
MSRQPANSSAAATSGPTISHCCRWLTPAPRAQRGK